ncbi:MAG: hypothetical protein WDN47_05210 [Candidatus Doudnabacteria bacterium]
MKEYLVSFDNIRLEHKLTDEEKAEKVEVFLRYYLITTADQIRLTQRIQKVYNPFSFKNFSWGKKFGGDDDPKFQKTLASLKDDFIKKETDEKLYHLDQGEGKIFNHYYYRLSPKIIEMIKKSTLIWLHYYTEKTYEPFYGFEDPSFYKEGRLVAHVVSHENYVHLFLDEDIAYNFMRRLSVEFHDITSQNIKSLK